jgi:hypothetical protein
VLPLNGFVNSMPPVPKHLHTFQSVVTLHQLLGRCVGWALAGVLGVTGMPLAAIKFL